MQRMSLSSQNHRNDLSRVTDLAFTPGLNAAAVKASSKPGADKTKMCLIIEDGASAKIHTFETLAQILAAVTESRSQPRKIICIIENISPKYIGVLESGWEIDPGFFVQYAENPEREYLWYPGEFKPTDIQEKFSCIDGNFEYHGVKVDDDKELNSLPNHFERHCYKSTWEGVETINSNTRISYYRVKKSFCKGFHDFLIRHYSRVNNRSFPCRCAAGYTKAI